MSEVIHVAVAAIVNRDNEVLISLRADDAHQGGLWEFPGGKIEKSETVEQALFREVREELGIQLISFRRLIRVSHQYEDREVLLDVWKVGDYSGEPSGMEGQTLRWQSINQLHELDFPEADVPVIQALNLPEHYLITGKFKTNQEFESRLSRAIDKGIKLVQLRLTDEWLSGKNKLDAMNIVDIAIRLCEQSDFTLMFNLPDAITTDVNSRINKSTGTYGMHLNSSKLKLINERPDCEFLSASCHNSQELKKSQQLSADFVVLSPVQVTASHPDMEPLGWGRFSELVDSTNVPVYALGGVGRDDTQGAWDAGGQGIAAISNLWIG